MQIKNARIPTGFSGCDLLVGAGIAGLDSLALPLSWDFINHFLISACLFSACKFQQRHTQQEVKILQTLILVLIHNKTVKP